MGNPRDAEQYYTFSRADKGAVSLSNNNNLRPGTYELEVYFSNAAEMSGELVLRIPVVVTN